MNLAKTSSIIAFYTRTLSKHASEEEEKVQRGFFNLEKMEDDLDGRFSTFRL